MKLTDRLSTIDILAYTTPAGNLKYNQLLSPLLNDTSDFMDDNQIAHIHFNAHRLGASTKTKTIATNLEGVGKLFEKLYSGILGMIFKMSSWADPAGKITTSNEIIF